MLNLQIDKRRIIPVRLIPFVTGGHVSPACLTEALAGKIEALRDRFQAQILDSEGNFEPMRESDWDALPRKLSELENERGESKSADNQHSPSWCEETLRELPARTFLWLEDLENAWKSPGFAEEPDPADLVLSDATLDLSTRIPRELFQSVYEGFEHLIISSARPEKRQSPAAIRVRELETYMRLDPFYGIDSDRPEALLEEIYEDNAGSPRFQSFRRRYLQIPFKNQHQHHLVLLWCGLMGLPAYRDNQSLTWEPREFLDHWSADFDLQSEELKEFLRDNHWPLPTWFFPHEIDNTYRKLALGKSAYDAAVHKYLVQLPEHYRELEELREARPNSMEERTAKKEELQNLEHRILELERGEVFAPSPMQTSNKDGDSKPVFDELFPSFPKSRRDIWAILIAEAIKEHLRQLGRVPQQSELWMRLCKMPPKGFPVESKPDRGGEEAIWCGTVSLGKKAFQARIRGYKKRR